MCIARQGRQSRRFNLRFNICARRARLRNHDVFRRRRETKLTSQLCSRYVAARYIFNLIFSRFISFSLKVPHRCRCSTFSKIERCRTSHCTLVIHAVLRTAIFFYCIRSHFNHFESWMRILHCIFSSMLQAPPKMRFEQRWEHLLHERCIAVPALHNRAYAFLSSWLFRERNQSRKPTGLGRQSCRVFQTSC